MHSNGRQGVAFEARVRLLAEGGSVTAHVFGFRVTNVNALTLQVVISTNYRGADAAAHCSRALEALRLKTFAQLRSANVADHKSLYRRVSIDLGANAPAWARGSDYWGKDMQRGGWTVGNAGGLSV